MKKKLEIIADIRNKLTLPRVTLESLSKGKDISSKKIEEAYQYLNKACVLLEKLEEETK